MKKKRLMIQGHLAGINTPFTFTLQTQQLKLVKTAIMPSSSNAHLEKASKLLTAHLCGLETCRALQGVRTLDLFLGARASTKFKNEATHLQTMVDTNVNCFHVSEQAEQVKAKLALHVDSMASLYI